MFSLHPSLRAGLLAGMTLLGSCTEQTTVSPETPADFGANRPDEPGNSGLVRSQGTYADLIFDFDSGLLAVIGLSSSIADFCGGADAFEPADFQVKPHQLGEVNSLVKSGEVTIQILAIPAETQGDFCLDFAGAPVLYQGTGRFVRTDNNFTPTGTNGGRANSFGLTATGTLTDLVNGGSVNFSGAYRLLISPDDEFREIFSRVNVSQ
jgi:hypothetical protein